MDDFRVYVIGKDGHIINRIDLACADESAARERAKQLVDGHAIELWQLGKMLERFEPKH